MKKTLIIILCTLLLLKGLINQNEIEKLTIVSGVAIDKMADGYSVTYEILSSDTDLSFASKSMFLTATGKSLEDALLNAQKKHYKKLYFGSEQIYLLSDDLISKFDDIFRYIINDENTNKNSVIVLTKNSAEKMLKKDINKSNASRSITLSDTLKLLKDKNECVNSKCYTQIADYYYKYSAFDVIGENGFKNIALISKEGGAFFLSEKQSKTYLLLTKEPNSQSNTKIKSVKKKVKNLDDKSIVSIKIKLDDNKNAKTLENDILSFLDFYYKSQKDILNLSNNKKIKNAVFDVWVGG